MPICYFVLKIHVGKKIRNRAFFSPKRYAESDIFSTFLQKKHTNRPSGPYWFTKDECSFMEQVVVICNVRLYSNYQGKIPRKLLQDRVYCINLETTFYNTLLITVKAMLCWILFLTIFPTSFNFIQLIASSSQDHLFLISIWLYFSVHYNMIYSI